MSGEVARRAVSFIEAADEAFPEFALPVVARDVARFPFDDLFRPIDEVFVEEARKAAGEAETAGRGGDGAVGTQVGEAGTVFEAG